MTYEVTTLISGLEFALLSSPRVIYGIWDFLHIEKKPLLSLRQASGFSVVNYDFVTKYRTRKSYLCWRLCMYQEEIVEDMIYFFFENFL